MTDGDDPAASPAGELFLPPADGVLWYHRALCLLSLPADTAGEGVWKREAAGVTLSVESAQPPAGTLARMLLMHVLDMAKRRDNPLVPLGADAAALLAAIGLAPAAATADELAGQATLLLGAHIGLGWNGAAPAALFDGRGRGRAAGGWRASVRIGARLFASLAENAVALDRSVLRALAENPLALDLYAWLASAPPGEATVELSWPELRARFGAQAGQPGEFRAGIEQALMQVQQQWPHFGLVFRDEGLVFRAPSAASASVPPAPEPPPPVQAPTADESARLLAELDSELGLVTAPEPELMPEPEPEPVLPARSQLPERGPHPARPAQAERQALSVKSHLSGLPQVVWLQRAQGRDNVVIEVTPGGRYDPELCTVIVLEPVTLQVAGGLYTRDFDRVAAWVAVNRDLIDDWWDSRLTDAEEALRRVKKVPAPAWR